MVGMLGRGCAATNPFSDSYLEAEFMSGISDYVGEVEQLENAVGQDASVAQAQCMYC